MLHSLTLIKLIQWILIPDAFDYGKILKQIYIIQGDLSISSESIEILHLTKYCTILLIIIINTLNIIQYMHLFTG